MTLTSTPRLVPRLVGLLPAPPSEDDSGGGGRAQRVGADTAEELERGAAMALGLVFRC
jgi:hypothetical protein